MGKYKKKKIDPKLLFKISKKNILNIGVKKTFSFIKKILINDIYLHFFGFIEGEDINTSLNQINIYNKIYGDIIIVATNKDEGKISDIYPIDIKKFTNLITNIQ